VVSESRPEPLALTAEANSAWDPTWSADGEFLYFVSDRDDSWGKRTLQKYSLNEKSYRYGFTLLPYVVSKDRLDRLVAR
jgi:Tol biopolymer transport system component